ncbi:serine/threonine protein kinase [Parafrankia irregularis]|uniref:non-specific serine/threonine protein kinase n=1 Tax=Parafrankia irregularis TaxID=795642 RepID=A0A0S4QQX4_9ACTN|nr:MULTISPECIES: Stk1 family PASTA domain-containing Ser/Thr kinase [Parafrankia]MBE3204414.1 Stk1 family PASTA domain-containing Ser/Thr kinase [Parafrankia sp. CH37]CUU57684.1 serine/threonine protein kinase [Parafrankia irregularis]
MTDVTERYDAQPRLVGERYELGGCIGYGGMAEVYRGRDIRLGREVAVKTLRADLARDPTFLARFRREAQSSASLNHPAIVSVYDTGEDVINGTQLPYIVMEFVEGQTLRDLLQARGPFDERYALQVTAEVCAALDYSHRMGIIHRDIKPANVMVGADGAAKVMDFGIARATTATSSTMTATSAVIGTAQYLSPEQARGARVDSRSDVYSTGVLLYELLTGEPPFRGDNPVAVAYQHVREIPPPPSSHDPRISPEADAIVLKAMEKEPDDRYATAGEMRDDLERALSGQRVHAMLMGGADQTMLGAQSTATAGTALLGRSGGGYDDRYDDRGRYQGDDYDDRTQVGRAPYDRYEQTGPYDRYDQPGRFDDDDRYADPGQGNGRGHRDDDRSGGSPVWKFVLAGLGAVVVFVVVALLASSMFGNKKNDDNTVAAGQLTIPTVVGSLFDDATRLLRSQGWEGQPQTTPKESDQAAGTVLAVDPDEGSKIDSDATINFTVAAEPGQVTIPTNLVGMTEQAATGALTELGLKVNVEKFFEAAKQGVGEVEQTNPAAGSPVDKMSTVTISVVNQNVNVPDVRNLDVQTATLKLESYGLKVEKVLRPDPSRQAGTVANQNPVGSAVPRGSTVQIIVVSASQQTTSPTPTSDSGEPEETPSPEHTTPPASTTPPTSTTPTATATAGSGLGGLGLGGGRPGSG